MVNFQSNKPAKLIPALFTQEEKITQIEHYEYEESLPINVAMFMQKSGNSKGHLILYLFNTNLSPFWITFLEIDMRSLTFC
jgi:hypothetical protein